jgi:hypothetical protein
MNEVKGKIVPVVNYHAMKTHEGVEVHLHVFLTSTLDADEWLASRPDRLTSKEWAPNTYWRGG